MDIPTNQFSKYNNYEFDFEEGSVLYGAVANLTRPSSYM